MKNISPYLILQQAGELQLLALGFNKTVFENIWLLPEVLEHSSTKTVFRKLLEDLDDTSPIKIEALKIASIVNNLALIIRHECSRLDVKNKNVYNVSEESFISKLSENRLEQYNTLKLLANLYGGS